MQPALRQILFGPQFYPGASVALDFLQNRYRVPGISPFSPDFVHLPGVSVTRASVGYDLAGTMLFASGAPRIVPGFGLLVEEARTNLFLNSFTPATQTITLSATGNYTITVWGSGSVAVSAGTATITGAATASAGSPVTINCTATGSITCTVSGSPSIVQVEAGAFGTSPIPTTGATATRAADVPKITGLSLVGDHTQVLDSNAANALGTYVHGRLSDGGANNREQYYQGSSATSLKVEALFGGVAQIASTLSITSGVAFRAAIAFGAGRYQTAANGSLGGAATGASSFTATTLELGETGGANQMNGYLRRWLYYPRAFSDAELRAVTQ